MRTFTRILAVTIGLGVLIGGGIAVRRRSAS